MPGGGGGGMIAFGIDPDITCFASNLYQQKANSPVTMVSSYLATTVRRLATSHLANVTGGGGGGGGPTYFFGSKIFNSCIFLGVEDLTVYFFGSEKSACIFLGSNFCQANGSYAIQAKVPERQKGSMYTVLKIAFLGYKSHVFFWV